MGPRLQKMGPEQSHQGIYDLSEKTRTISSECGTRRHESGQEGEGVGNKTLQKESFPQVFQTLYSATTSPL